jgi:hypothetical protein
VERQQQRLFQRMPWKPDEERVLRRRVCLEAVLKLPEVQMLLIDQ